MECTTVAAAKAKKPNKQIANFILESCGSSIPTEDTSEAGGLYMRRLQITCDNLMQKNSFIGCMVMGVSRVSFFSLAERLKFHGDRNKWGSVVFPSIRAENKMWTIRHLGIILPYKKSKSF